ncbi:MAG: tRNA lysidine(34) synthetase TilS [Actinobacteria bacterium]|nr:tRNA lysidine(34) synthetase TilS [Actinomycetota bacterium]
MHQRDIYLTIKKFVTENNLIIHGQKIICSVSGGPDSLCMLLALHRLGKEFDLSISVFHLNHMLREYDSEADAAFVAEVAREIGVEAYIETCDILRLAEQKKKSIELTAREERIRRLRARAKEIKADRIATGHTLSDQAETVLYRIIRGCGLNGLSAMRPLSGIFIKPLLCIYREQSEQFCQELGYEYRVDRTNFDLSCDRNRIRNRVIPLVNELFNRDIRSSLVRLAELAEEDNVALEDISSVEFDKITVKSKDEIRILKADLLRQPDAILKRVLRRILLLVKGEVADVDEESIKSILKILNSSGGYKTVDVGSGIKVESEYDWIIFSRKPAAKEKFKERYLDIPGDLKIDEISISFKARIYEGGQVHILRDECMANIDLNAIKGEIKVRPWHEGDRMIPLGMGVEKKVHDIFVDKKIPFQKRRQWPILCDQEKIIWIPGVKLDDRVKVREGTEKVLRIESVWK